MTKLLNKHQNSKLSLQKIYNMPLFPSSFSSHYVETTIGRVFVRKGGSGAPLLLLHGFPQTHVEWHKMAGELAETR
jgi:pimeloyl-ACP methyl ester carboxylesterase